MEEKEGFVKKNNEENVKGGDAKEGEDFQDVL